MPFTIVLINPPPRNEADRHWARFPLLGMAYVASSAIKAGYDVHILDGKLAALTDEEIVQRVNEIQPDLVGITCMTVEFPISVEIANNVKKHCTSPIIIGGAHVNAVGQDVLLEAKNIDYACIGEGEFLLNELAYALENNLPVTSIPGLAYRIQDHIFRTPERAYPENYDILSYPAWWLFEKVEQIPILTHRGCPFKCTFCGHNSGFKPRYRTPENVIDELEFVINKYKPKIIRFEDETFGLHMKRTKKILYGILEKGLHEKVKFSAQTRVDRLDEEFVSILKKANFETLELGVESGNAEILKSIKKGITLDQVRYAVKLAKKNHLHVWCKFILGHPSETLSTIKDTVRIIAEMNPDQLSVSIMTPYPGTPIYDMAVRGENGYRLLVDDWASFDKYSKGALELEGVSISQLKMYQIICYLNLYIRNFRYIEFSKLIWQHRTLAKEMMIGLITSYIPVFTKKRQAKSPT